MMMVSRSSLTIVFFLLSASSIYALDKRIGDGTSPGTTGNTDLVNKFNTQLIACINKDLNNTQVALQGGGAGADNLDLKKDAPPVVISFDQCIQQLFLTSPEAKAAANAK